MKKRLIDKITNGRLIFQDLNNHLFKKRIIIKKPNISIFLSIDNIYILPSNFIAYKRKSRS